MDADQVELSGITNRLYFENEEIYHITWATSQILHVHNI